MKVPTILKSAWSAIKSLFSNSDKTIQEAIRLSVRAVEWLKTATDSQLFDMATMIIPGTWDDKLLTSLRAVLPKVLAELQLLPSEIQKAEGDVKSAFTGSVAANLARELTEFKVSYGDTKLLVENAYKTEVKGLA